MIQRSSKIAVQYLYQRVKKNVETVTGENIAYILKLSGYEDINQVNSRNLSKIIQFDKMKEEDEWRVRMIREITNIKQNVLYLDPTSNESFDNDQLNDIIDFLSTT